MSLLKIVLAHFDIDFFRVKNIQTLILACAVEFDPFASGSYFWQ